MKLWVFHEWAYGPIQLELAASSLFGLLYQILSFFFLQTAKGELKQQGYGWTFTLMMYI